MGPQRRSHRLELILAVILLLPALALVAGAKTYLPFAAMPAVLMIPSLAVRRRRRPPGHADPSDGDGGDGGSPTPESPNTLPGGGLPLPDAVQAPMRYRGTRRTSLIPPRERRAPREPERPTVPSRPAVR